MDAVIHLAPTVGVVAACDSLGVARASFYRQRPVLGPSASPTATTAAHKRRPLVHLLIADGSSSNPHQQR